MFFFLISFIGKPLPWLTGYDFALFFSIPAAVIFFVVSRAEFLRLDQVRIKNFLLLNKPEQTLSHVSDAYSCVCA